MLGTLSLSCDCELDGLASFLSLSTVFRPPCCWGHSSASGFGNAGYAGDRSSAAGKLDLPFRVGGHPVASCGTITPAANRSQDIAVAGGSGALQNQRTVHAPVGADDEAHFHLQSCDGRNQQRIGSGQCLG